MFIKRERAIAFLITDALVKLPPAAPNDGYGCANVHALEQVIDLRVGHGYTATGPIVATATRPVDLNESAHPCAGWNKSVALCVAERPPVLIVGIVEQEGSVVGGFATILLGDDAIVPFGRGRISRVRLG